MSRDLKGFYQFGGISLVLSGTLFFIKYLFEIKAGPPPGDGAGILVWVETEKFSLSMIPEVLFFALSFLVPGVMALYQSLVMNERTKATLGCGILAITIPLLALLDVLGGRLVYPIYGLRLKDPDIAEFIVSTYFGGLHAVGILMGIATVVLSLALRKGNFGRGILGLGIATGIFDLIGSYPWLIGPVTMAVSQGLFFAWFVVVGIRLYKAR